MLQIFHVMRWPPHQPPSRCRNCHSSSPSANPRYSHSSACDHSPLIPFLLNFLVCTRFHLPPSTSTSCILSSPSQFLFPPLTLHPCLPPFLPAILQEADHLLLPSQGQAHVPLARSCNKETHVHDVCMQLNDQHQSGRHSQGHRKGTYPISGLVQLMPCMPQPRMLIVQRCPTHSASMLIKKEQGGSHLCCFYFYVYVYFHSMLRLLFPSFPLPPCLTVALAEVPSVVGMCKAWRRTPQCFCCMTGARTQAAAAAVLRPVQYCTAPVCCRCRIQQCRPSTRTRAAGRLVTCTTYVVADTVANPDRKRPPSLACCAALQCRTASRPSGCMGAAVCPCSARSWRTLVTGCPESVGVPPFCRYPWAL